MSLKEIKSLISTMFTNIDDDLSEVGLFKSIKNATGIKPSRICIAVVLLITVLAVLEIAADILTTLFGMMYPAYRSFKVLLFSNRPSKKKTKIKRMCG